MCAVTEMTETTTSLLDGVTVPLVTTMNEDRVPNAALARPLLDSMAAAEIDNLMLLGSNGEGALLPADLATPFAVEAAQVWRELRGATSKLFVTVFGAGTRIGLDNARSYMAAQPDALVVATPLYFAHTEDELVDHFAHFADFDVPVIAYNIPRYTGNPITLGVLERLIDMPHVVGMKDSSVSDEYLLEAVALTRRRPEFSISQGNEKRLAWAVQQGARGITPGLANLAPRLCMSIFAAAKAGDGEAALRLQDQITALTGIHGIRPGLTAMKAALNLLGLSPATPAAPFRVYSQEEMDRLKAVLVPLLDHIGGRLA